MRISDWSSDVCSSDLLLTAAVSAGLLLGATACGKRGAPKPPQGQESEYVYPGARSEERRVGKECASTCRSWRSPIHKKKNKSCTSHPVEPLLSITCQPNCHH